jgi:hypothetical protein
VRGVVVSGTAVQLLNVMHPRAQFGRSSDDHLNVSLCFCIV